MRNYIRQLILFIIGLLLIVGIYIVDVIFYRVPNFIKVFRIEREVASVVAILLIFPLIKALYINYIKSMKSIGIFLLSMISGLFALLFLPQIIFTNYIVLWDNNPMLAEYPVVWNLYSIFCASIFSLTLMLLFYIIKRMIISGSNQLVKAGYNIMFLLIIIGAGLLNFLEDRYLYQPVLDGYLGLFNEYKVGLISFMILSASVSINGNWHDELNRRGKIFYTIGGIVLIFLLAILFSSRHIVAVYSFGTTIKGFILLGFIAVSVFFIVSVLKLLVHLPTAAKLDRVALELDYISRIENAIIARDKTDNSIINMILEMSSELTNANGCWMEIQTNGNEFKIIESINIDQKLIDDIGYFTMDDLKDKLITQGEVCIIPNVSVNPLTKHFKLLNCTWKSMIAMPLQSRDGVVGVLYIVKNRTSAFDENAQKTLYRFVTQLEKIITSNNSLTEIVATELEITSDTHQLYLTKSNRFAYEYLESQHNYKHCIFGIDNTIQSEKIAELRGSLKILLKLNNPIEQIVSSAYEILAQDNKKQDYVFYFINSKSNEIQIYYSDMLYYITSNQNDVLSVEDNKISVKFEDWGVFWLNNQKFGGEIKKDIFIGIKQLPSNIHHSLKNIKDCFIIKSIIPNN